MQEFISSPFPFLIAFILFIVSDIIKFKKWAKFCRYFAFTILAITCIFWTNQVNEKLEASERYFHRELVTSVTSHVEKLIESGDYKTAETILKRFNSNYWEYADNNEELKNLVESMNIPRYSRVSEALEKLNNNQ